MIYDLTTDKAVNAAVKGQWDIAIALNKEILTKYPNDVPALNRLGRALIAVGDLAGAKDAYVRSLKADPLDNAVASVQLSRIEDGLKAKPNIANPGMFVEESRKTIIVELDMKVNTVLPGEKLVIVQEGSCLKLQTEEGRYLGVIPQYVSSTMVRLMAGGNKYSAYFISRGKAFIREDFRSAEQLNMPSFPEIRYEDLEV